jgi:hypothetical protein
MSITEQVKWACQLSFGQTPNYLHETLNALGIENKVEVDANGKWSVFFRNENSTPDSPKFTNLEFEVPYEK